MVRRLSRGKGPDLFAQRLALDAERLGWRDAALRALPQRPRLPGYIANERAADLRFLLPGLPAGSALLAGGALSPVPFALASTCTSVVVLSGETESRFLMARARQEGVANIKARTTHPPGEKFSLVAGLVSAPGLDTPGWNGLSLVELARMVEPGGSLYLEIGRSSVAPPGLRFAYTRWRLRRVGFGRVRAYWPKPSFYECEMLMPLGDRTLQRYYLDHLFFAMSPARRILRAALRAAVEVGLFEAALPSYALVAVRRDRRRAGGTSARPAR